MRSGRSRGAKKDSAIEDRAGNVENLGDLRRVLSEECKIPFSLPHLWTEDGLSLDRAGGGGCFNLLFL